MTRMTNIGEGTPHNACIRNVVGSNPVYYQRIFSLQWETKYIKRLAEEELGNSKILLVYSKVASIKKVKN